MKKSAFFLLAALFLFTSLPAQDLHVYIDAQTRDIKYTSNGKTLSRPSVKRGNNIFIHLENFNNFLYDVVIKEREENNVAQTFAGGSMGFAGGGSGGGLMGLFQNLGFMNPISPFAGESLGKLGGMGSSDDFGNMGFADDTEEEATVDSRLFQLKAQFKNALKDVEQIENNLSRIDEKVNNFMDGRRLNAIALQEVQQIKTNPRFKPDQIRKLSGEYFEKVLDVSDGEEIEIGTLLDKTDSKKMLSKQEAALVENEMKLRKKQEEIEGISAELAVYDMATEGFINLRDQVFDAENNIQATLFTIEENKKLVGELKEKAPKEDLQLLTQLRYEYEEINSNNFAHQHRSEADGNRMVYDVFLKVRHTDDSEYTEEIPITKVRVPVHGGLQVNASAGLSFGRFFDQPQSYFVRDDVIQAEDEDSFSPFLATFIHFYFPSAKTTSPGASLGIGFPLAGGDVSSLSFFLGPSLVLGNNQRLVLSGGLMGGRVEKLTEGFQVGDTFLSESTLVPTKNSYELGYYIGLTFNLIGN